MLFVIVSDISQTGLCYQIFVKIHKTKFNENLPLGFALIQAKLPKTETETALLV
jgi:hypothetical protein